MARMMEAAIQGSAESCAVAGLLSPPAVAWNGTACAGAALLDDALAETIILPPGALVPRRLARRPFYVLRYASVVECGAADSSSVCLAFKTVDPTRADGLARFVAAGLGVIRGAVAADGLNFSTAGLVVPPRIRPESFCHNLAGPLRLPDGTFLMLGGESNFWTASEPKDHFGEAALQGTRALAPTTLVDPASGIFVARGPDWLYSKAWEPPTLAIRGDHAGCVDRRLRTGYRGCEYDGRLSVVHFRGRHWLYARANLRECAPTGGRFVHVATSADARQWSPFQLLTIDGYHPDSGDIYFFAAQRSPVDDDSLLALFPLSQPAGGCIAAAFSADGVRWTAPLKLRGCKLAPEGRTEDHPVAGGAVRRGGRVHFYVQRAVPGIAPRSQGTSIVRYSLSAARLAALTRRALRSLHRPPAASRGSRRRLVQEREATTDAARPCATAEALALRDRYAALGGQLRAGGFDEEAIVAARRSFTFAPDPEPRWYAAPPWSYPADAVRVIALPLSQDDDGGIERVRRLAARAAREVAEALPPGAARYAQPQRTLHATIYHPGHAPGSPWDARRMRAPTEAELAAEDHAAAAIAAAAAPVELVVDRLAFTRSGVLLLLLRPADECAPSPVGALRDAAAAAFAGAHAQRTTQLVHVSLLRLLSLPPAANRTAAARAVADVVDRWSARLRGVRGVVRGLRYVREEQIITLAGRSSWLPFSARNNATGRARRGRRARQW